MSRLISVASPCNAATSPSTSDIGDIGFQRIAPGTRSGCLKSRNYPQNYPSNIFDEVIIPTTGFTTLTIIIQDMQVRN